MNDSRTGDVGHGNGESSGATGARRGDGRSWKPFGRRHPYTDRARKGREFVNLSAIM